jgi:hypothetical protein
MTTWSDYQEDAAGFFRSLGMDAKTNQTLTGVRGTHNVDVLVTYGRAGIDQTWIVECKQWRRRVTKLHVEALVSIVSDVGADRGFILSETGFQSGAILMARMSNITLTSLADLRENAAEEITESGLSDARRRIQLLNARLIRANNQDRANTPGDGFWVPADAISSVRGQLGFAEMGLISAALEDWPVLYGADLVADRGYRAADRTELANALLRTLDMLEASVEEIERRVGRGEALGH